MSMTAIRSATTSLSGTSPTNTPNTSSISSDPTKGGDIASGNAEITADGRYVAFRSSATNLVASVTDTNDAQDIFIRDRVLGTTRVVSVKGGGGVKATSNAGSVGIPDITPDGRFVVFTSTASNAIPNDTSPIADAYMVDLTKGSTRLISTNNAGTASANAPTTEVKITDDAERVIFASYASNLEGDFDKLDTDFAAIFSRNLFFNRNSVISFDRGGNPAGANSSNIVISADSTRVGYDSDSIALVSNDRNNTSDVFLNIIPGKESASIDNNGKLTVRGSPVDDAINIQKVSGRIVVRRDSERLDFDVDAVKSIEVYGYDGNGLGRPRYQPSRLVRLSGRRR